MRSRSRLLAAKLSYFLFLIPYLVLFSSCSSSRQISRSANILLKDSALVAGHIGIHFYEPAASKTWYSHNADKYFIPASNTKLFSLYAGLKFVPDSLPAFRYYQNSDTTIIQPTGDPTFLHPDFPLQKGLAFLKHQKSIIISLPDFTDHIGKGWAWDDYKEYYMAQRSSLPMYGNVVSIHRTLESFDFMPAYFQPSSIVQNKSAGFSVQKAWDKNEFIITEGTRRSATVPFRPDDNTIMNLLADTLHIPISLSTVSKTRDKAKVFYSVLADSMYKIMMHRSDNFFAEQTLLMASNEMLGDMDDGKMIDHILSTELRDAPQKPKWVDGSGLSRYNLFTPQAFVYLLNKMRNDFGLERMKTILPTGGEGTLENYYISEKGFIYAKTGTLSNNLALSGYIFTRKNKLLLFSILVNNFPSGATPVRKAIEKFVTGIIRKY